ncbi:MAG: diguanylate cyclase domain-containing protein [Rhodanobacter sp.]
MAESNLQPAALAVAMPTAGVLAHTRLLDSVAAFTHHRDLDALDHSLVLSLAELSQARSVSLGKRVVGGSGVSYSLVRCMQDVEGAYHVQMVEPDQRDPMLALMSECMDRMESQQKQIGGGIYRQVVPIISEGRAIGALKLESAMPPEASQPLVNGFARIYANYTALLNESERDKLTGLYNRRSFERHLQRMLLCAARLMNPGAGLVKERRLPSTPSQVWLAILDIDHFKRVNDTYGHIYGDEVILLLAQQMRACFRNEDVLFRFGGEEFVVLLNVVDETAVSAVLERFRARMAAYAFPQVDQITVSIGYARIGVGDYPATVIDRADKALYYSKEHGRNCTHGYEALIGNGLLTTEVLVQGSVDLF